MRNAHLQPGIEVYYEGDRANHAGYGVIVERVANSWGEDVLIQLDDEREMWVDVRSFDPGVGRRFWTKAEWRERRAAAMAQLEAQLRK